ncbi:MAG: hypothetical protein PVH12_05355 [Candidatus Bathyarchaeota archaeon]|jgi:hypothetical protein
MDSAIETVNLTKKFGFLVAVNNFDLKRAPSVHEEMYKFAFRGW